MMKRRVGSGHFGEHMAPQGDHFKICQICQKLSQLNGIQRTSNLKTIFQNFHEILFVRQDIALRQASITCQLDFSERLLVL